MSGPADERFALAAVLAAGRVEGHRPGAAVGQDGQDHRHAQLLEDLLILARLPFSQQLSAGEGLDLGCGGDEVEGLGLDFQVEGL